MAERSARGRLAGVLAGCSLGGGSGAGASMGSRDARARDPAPLDEAGGEVGEWVALSGA